MAEIKVSQLPEASEINDADLLMIVQSGTNKKITKANARFASGDEVSIGTTEPSEEEKLWINPNEVPSGTGSYISNVYSDATDKGYSCHYINGVELYSNASGSNAQITLSDSVTNYKYVEITYKDDQDIMDTKKLKVTNGGWYYLSVIQYLVTQGQVITRGKNIQLNNNKINLGNAYAVVQSASGNTLYSNDNIYIMYVVGYK